MTHINIDTIDININTDTDRPTDIDIINKHKIDIET